MLKKTILTLLISGALPVSANATLLTNMEAPDKNQETINLKSSDVNVKEKTNTKNVNQITPIEKFFKDKNASVLLKKEINNDIVGYLIKINGSKMEVYTNKSGTLIINNAINLNNLNKVENNYSDIINPINFKKVISVLENSELLIHSNPKSNEKVYVFSGSLCPHCAKLHKKLKDENLLNSNLDIVTVPVIFNNPYWKTAWLKILSVPEEKRESMLEKTYNAILKKNNNYLSMMISNNSKFSNKDDKKILEGLNELNEITIEAKVMGTPTILLKSNEEWKKLKDEKTKDIVNSLKKYNKFVEINTSNNIKVEDKNKS